jgi:pimeloyl-ACP methyl ester carboxylesterase
MESEPSTSGEPVAPVRASTRGETRIWTSDGTALALEEAEPEQGELIGAPPLVLLHGLTATRRYVVMGSRLLQRAGARVISYDARGHGESEPAVSRASPVARSDAEAIRSALAADDARGARVTFDVESELHDAYGYHRLARDLRDLLNGLGIERAALAGVSMGAHTIARFALDHPERVAALAFITPAFDADDRRGADDYVEWDALARGLRENGVDGFLAAYDFSKLPDAWRETVATVVRQRLSAHVHPDAVADALEVVPRSVAFDSMSELSAIDAPTTVIGDRDEADPDHPLAVAERYAAAIAGAQLLVEESGSSPLAWQGAQVSRALAELLRRAR